MAEMTWQYIAGELSVLLGRLQEVTTTEAARGNAGSLRQAAETRPLRSLGDVAEQALAFADGLCWQSLNEGDAATFARLSAVSAELRDFAVCAGLIGDD